MPRVWRVRDRASFAALRQAGERRRAGALTVIRLTDTDDRPPRVAYAIGRPVGSATARNRLRRRLRAAVADIGPPSGTYLVSAGPTAATLPYQELRRQLTDAMTPERTPADAKP